MMKRGIGYRNVCHQCPRSQPTTVLDRIERQSIPEGTELIVQARATDTDLPVNTLTYSLTQGPSGATIDPTTGRMRWTPTEADGPRTYGVTIRVVDGKGGEDTEFFFIDVQEVNQPPLLDPIADQVIDEGGVVNLHFRATDPSVPPIHSRTRSIRLAVPIAL